MHISRCTHCSYEYIISRKEIIQTKKKQPFHVYDENISPFQEVCMMCCKGIMIQVEFTNGNGKTVLFHQLNKKYLCLTTKLSLHVSYYSKMRKFKLFSNIEIPIHKFTGSAQTLADIISTTYFMDIEVVITEISNDVVKGFSNVNLMRKIVSVHQNENIWQDKK